MNIHKRTAKLHIIGELLNKMSIMLQLSRAKTQYLQGFAGFE